MNRLQCIQSLPALLWLGLWLSASDARGDGGVIRLRETQSPFVIAIFTPSEIAANSPAEISVMIQREGSSEPMLDATVNLTFTAPASSAEDPEEQVCGPSETGPWGPASGPKIAQLTVPATRRQASNKLLYAALVKFDAAGQWRMQALVERGHESVKIGCNIPVASPPGRLVKLLPYLLLPPLMVALFVVNRRLRRQGLGSGWACHEKTDTEFV
jgi:hypothetical protein